MFYLGTHEPSWLSRTDAPLFLSRRRLARRPTWPRALGRWALDSGGFSELSLYGRWQTTPEQYAGEARRWADTIGNLDWAAQQDWMCEPVIVARTGLSVREHQGRTIANYHELRHLAPDVPWIPVLQGFQRDDYLRHVEDWTASGVDLPSLPRVGLGSVCRRQDTDMVEGLIRELHAGGIRLHGFGFKLKGLVRVAAFLASSDSLSWSYQARRNPPLEGCAHAKCNNCFRYALRWREQALKAARRPEQGLLF